MTTSELMEFTAEALILVLFLSMPPIIAAALVGTLVALFQALTQVQEQTLSFSIKLSVVVLVIFAVGAWLGQELYHFANDIFGNIGSIVN